jgi:hypothetical protein
MISPADGLMSAMDTTTTTTTTTPTNVDPADAKLLLADVLARAARFRDRRLAFDWAAHAVRSQVVLHGDDGRYWVVSPADAARLERLGYEYAD